VIVAALSSEGAARFLSKHGRFFHQTYRTTALPGFWADIDPGFGVWHEPHATFRHTTKCWDVTYSTNSYGARDAERERRSTARRHVVLGDSFVEGYGVGDGVRMTDRLEAATGEPFLNFGTSGGFGTVQELVQYRTLASAFDHADVLLFILPLNDFVDNDPARNQSSRYRPYLRRVPAGTEIFYTTTFDARDTGEIGITRRSLNWLGNHAYVMDAALQTYDRRHDPQAAEQWLSYRGYTPADLDVMAAAVRELGVAAAGRVVHVFIIPSEIDLGRYRRESPFAFPSQLRGAVAGASNVDVTDLLPDFLDYARSHHVRPSAFFATCDAHWSPLGHQVAAESVMARLRLR